MIMARPPSSPLAAYNSSPLSNNAHLLPTSEGDSTSMPWQGSTVASCSTSPLASSPVPSRGPSASTLRRSQYKSRSSATSNVPSSPLSRWHDRLLQNCAQRVKKDRAKSRAGSRGGLIEQESQEPLTEEEQMMVRKLWRREMERRQEQLEDDWENQQLGIIDEKDIEELDGAQGKSDCCMRPCYNLADECSCQTTSSPFLQMLKKCSCCSFKSLMLSTLLTMA